MLPSSVTAVQPSFRTSHARLAGIHHRLDGQHHALRSFMPRPRCAVVGNLRIFVHPVPMPWPTKSRTTENPSASTTSCTAAPISPSVAPGFTVSIAACSEASVTFSNRARLLVDLLAHRHRDRRVAVKAIDNRAAVDRDDVAFLQNPLLRRNAVHHFTVDRGAEHARIPVIALECRLGAQFVDLGLGRILKIQGRRARLHLLRTSPAPGAPPCPRDACARLSRADFRMTATYPTHPSNIPLIRLSQPQSRDHGTPIRRLWLRSS